MPVHRKRASCGLDLITVPDLNNSLKFAADSGYDFVSIPLVHPRFKREFLCDPAKQRPGAFTRSDMLLPCQDWTSLIVAKVSPWLEVDSEIENIRKNSEKALKQEMMYAAHLSVPAILISLTSDQCANYARCIFNNLRDGAVYQNLFQVWVHIPMVAPIKLASQYRNDVPEDDQENISDEDNPWQWWRLFHGICNADKKIGVALEVSADIPSDDVVNRWLGEPVRVLLMSTSVFLSNSKGYPVLSRAHQNMTKRFMKLDAQVIITGVNRHSDVKYYHQYIQYLCNNLPVDGDVDHFARGYEDYLQCPLQPLMDNLESQTYEIFEKDPVKYTEYQRAVCNALKDRVPEDKIDDVVVTVMVVGAGRGPLVKTTLNASAITKRKVKIYAVEKNPNAVVTLQTLQDEEWGDQVTIVSCDMREWNPPEQADIIISELLGSFGDNELSPECLDKIQKFLKEDGISIPCNYTSYLCPIQSAKLYNEVRSCKEKEKYHLANLETPYVVFIKNCTELSEIQPVFRFVHPNKDAETDNTRYKVLKFPIKMDSVIHGFAGYFDTCLYGDIYLSILPETYSSGMLSWFPILFPVEHPLYLKKGDELRVHFWRCVSTRNVWYEWLITKPHVGTIHNPGGRSYTIGL